MQITLENIGKRFLFEWIFKDISYTIAPYSSTALIGSNGSGKSTLIKIISGKEQPSKGKISYQNNGSIIDPDKIYHRIGFVAPYQDLVEELTLKEHIYFHCQLTGSDFQTIEQKLNEHSNLQKSWNKQISYFSSGMKQRVKLAIALFSNNEVLLLDEPTSNLDESGILWFQKEIIKLKGIKTILICSNQKFEYEFCDEILNVTNFKPS